MLLPHMIRCFIVVTSEEEGGGVFRLCAVVCIIQTGESESYIFSFGELRLTV